MNEESIIQPDAAIIRDLAASIGSPNTARDEDGIEGAPYTVLPPGYTVASLEDTLANPLRKKGALTLRDATSFIRLVNAEKAPATRLYGTVTPPSFTAVFDDHGDLAGWRQHTARYQCPLSVEWTTWSAANKRTMNQPEFAQFVEDNAPDCVTPPAAEMMEIARTLEAKKKVNFASGVRLSNGEQELTYEETISGTAAKGKLALPEVFTLGIPVLDGGPKYALQARLRYRIGDGGKLVIWFDLVRPHKLVEDAVAEVWKQIEAETSLPVFHGA